MSKVIGYRSGSCRNSDDALSHTYAMTAAGNLWPMCEYGWNRSDGHRFSIFRGAPALKATARSAVVACERVAGQSTDRRATKRSGCNARRRLIVHPTYSVKLKRRRWQVCRFIWHVRNGELRRYGYSWWQIWCLCGNRAGDTIK